MAVSSLSNWYSIPERVVAGLNFLNNNVDRNRGCLPYFNTNFEVDPAYSQHDWPDFGDLTGRYVEAFVKARQLLGVKSPNQTELALRTLLMSFFDSDDGLSYRIKPSRPYFSRILQTMYDLHVAEGFDQSRVLWGLLAWYRETHDAEVHRRILELLSALQRVMVIKEDYGYYDRSAWNRGDVIPQNAPPMRHQLYFAGGQIHPLIEVYRHTDNPLTLELAERLTRFVIYHSDYFNEDGSWNCAADEGWASSTNGHVHTRLATLAGIMTVGHLTSNQDYFTWAKRAYEWFLEFHSSSFGWSPEFLERLGDAEEGCETCELMDDINCALILAEAGFPEYYDRAERVTRNQLFESQILDASMFKNTVKKEDTENDCFTNVGNMVLGGFAGWAGPNDFIGTCENNYYLMNCCGPSGVTAMCKIWDTIYSQDEQGVTVNIWMDKEDDLLCIISAQPAEGFLEVRAKEDIPHVSILLPGFVDVESITLSIEERKCEFAVKDNCIRAGSLKKGGCLNLQYDLNHRREKVHTNGRDFEVTWRGNSVVEINPAGKVFPFYVGNKLD